MASSQHQPLPPLPLQTGLNQRLVVSSASDLSFHIIEAGSKGRPLILLVHGFPEIAYSWRKIMPSLAEAGFYTAAVDQRGYGRTTGWDTRGFNAVDLDTFSTTNQIRDVIVLVHALGYDKVRCIVGHDFGAVTASLCALSRPDLFLNVVLMSHPFKGSPQLPLDTVQQETSEETGPTSQPDIHTDLAGLTNPRKHYKWYYSTKSANAEMSPPSGLHEFLRGYFYLKSADWSGNKPYPLRAWTATELAKMPYYYIMPLDFGMRDVVVNEMASEDIETVKQRSSRWLPDSELDVYVQEYSRTGFQGGLNWYRIHTDPFRTRDLDVLAGKKIEVPCLFVSGSKDWGTYQEPGAIQRMGDVCTDFRGVKLIDRAGHWVQQEQPEAVIQEMLALLTGHDYHV